MDWQRNMNQAMDYIEENLAGTVRLETAARFVLSSVWDFQRIFSFLVHLPVGEYIRLRKLTLAAEDLRTGGMKVIDVAVKYGYDSAAAFSRAFAKAHGVPPVSARDADVTLRLFSRITFENIEKEKVERMSKFGERGYVVRENGPVYFTEDMDATVRWFEEVLGWYGDVVAREADGKGGYGCVFDYPSEIAVAHLTPFRGFHLFPGKPAEGVVGFLMIEGVDALRRYVLDHGWTQVSEVIEQPWGAREIQITTPEHNVLRFFESTV